MTLIDGCQAMHRKHGGLLGETSPTVHEVRFILNHLSVTILISVQMLQLRYNRYLTFLQLTFYEIALIEALIPSQ